MKLLNLVRERISEDWRETDIFLVEDSVVNPEEALRNAVRDYMQTEEGKQSILNSCKDFNWGDAMMDVPNEYLNLYGIYKMVDDVETIIVNQDEILFPEIQELV
ncbi:MAG: hypothetical protein IJ086_07420 [Clostridium sp.]|nr:hypothetical protein [Clostridium sp.]MBQ8998498.1 hypothetical protein [Clostridium sp.]